MVSGGDESTKDFHYHFHLLLSLPGNSSKVENLLILVRKCTSILSKRRVELNSDWLERGREWDTVENIWHGTIKFFSGRTRIRKSADLNLGHWWQRKEQQRLGAKFDGNCLKVQACAVRNKCVCYFIMFIWNITILVRSIRQTGRGVFATSGDHVEYGLDFFFVLSELRHHKCWREIACYLELSAEMFPGRHCLWVCEWSVEALWRQDSTLCQNKWNFWLVWVVWGK